MSRNLFCFISFNYDEKKYKLIKKLLIKIWLWSQRLVTQLGGRTIALLFAALAVAMISVVFTDAWIVSVSKQVENIKTVRINVANLHQLKSSFFEAESAQRGYLLTSKPSYIAPFDGALKRARDLVKSIETNIVNQSRAKKQPVDLKWVRAITANIDSKSAEMILTIRLMNQNKQKEALEVINLDVGRLEMQKFIMHTDKLINEHNLKIDDLIDKRRSTVNLARASVIGGSLLLISLVVMVIKQLLTELRLKSELQNQAVAQNTVYENKLLQQTKLLRSMALDYQSDVERERQKLSRELHDELGSIFTATKMDLAWTIKKLADIAPDLVTKLTKTTSYIDQGIQFQRHIVQELHPSMISTFGFWPALNALIKDAAERNKWALKLNLPEETVKLNETISLVTYRIVQESLNNANKYAKATEVIIDIMLDDNHLKMEIEDNGIGIDTAALKSTTHGLSGMRHRVLAIGGHFEMISKPGEGVYIMALIPLDVVANGDGHIEASVKA